MDVRELDCDGIDWIYLVQDRDQWSKIVNMVMKLRAP
jgi:hypothetical protein